MMAFTSLFRIKLFPVSPVRESRRPFRFCVWSLKFIRSEAFVVLILLHFKKTTTTKQQAMTTTTVE